MIDKRGQRLSASTSEAQVRAAFHKPFSQVDKGCMTWIRGQVA
jgi:hypothetical protein